MRYNGVKGGYEYLLDTTELCFSDILTIQQYMWDCSKILDYDKDNYIYKGRIVYYTNLGNFILKGLSVNMTMDDNFNQNLSQSAIYQGLMMIRKKYLDLIFCFSGDLVGSRWKNAIDLSYHNHIREEVLYYRELSKECEKHIKKIDDIISKIIGIDFNKYVSIRELKSSYGFNLNLDEIQNEYFSF